MTLSLEARVGLLILGAVGLLTAFVVALVMFGGDGGHSACTEGGRAWICRHEGDGLMQNMGTQEAPMWIWTATETCRCMP